MEFQQWFPNYMIYFDDINLSPKRLLEKEKCESFRSLGEN